MTLSTVSEAKAEQGHKMATKKNASTHFTPVDSNEKQKQQVSGPIINDARTFRNQQTGDEHGHLAIQLAMEKCQHDTDDWCTSTIKLT